MIREAPHVLYIAWGFPPSRGSGVYRALATANALVDAGFRVTVLTCEREAFYRYTLADPTLESRIDSRVEVVRIPFEWPVMDFDVRRWDRDRARHPRAWTLRRVEEDQKGFPEANYGSWLEPLVAAARSIHARDPIQLTVATANPNVSVGAAHRLHGELGIPFVLDQRDSWTVDVFDGTENPNPRVHEFEAAFVADALEVWFVNEPLRADYAERYPASADRIFSVPNGYDPGLAPEPVLHAADPARPLTYGYLGTLTPKVPLVAFRDGWRAARARGGEVANAEAKLWGHLGFFAVKDAALAQLLEESDDGVHYAGPVEKAAVRTVFEEIDVLLLIIGAGRYVTSGKVYEYMASALPIVSVQEPGGDSARVLEGYPLWFPAADLTPEGIAQALEDAGRAAREADESVRRQCAAHAEQYERSRQFAPRMAVLFDAVAVEEGS
ncbi:glycosyltransferase [Pimelobacter simplex]|uniref:glycosyltransferase n=1 Tax=Nocardioides simplex TaxID=2045 RepID=UPI00214FAA54|nr:glycosyltransferase [Pimelobacter simplex]UUW91635.1 glycosyltransferase [Pimelobacter simplex]UUW95463.1 glycosyltransferase [Pimelobacter simplex]